MTKSKKILIVIAAILGVLLMLPLLIPVRAYLDQIEQIASQNAGIPVTIDAGRLRMLPTPRLVMQGIVAGHQQDMVVDSLTIIPKLSTLFASTLVIDIEVYKPRIKQAAVDLLKQHLAAPHPAADSQIAVSIGNIRLRGMQLDVDSVKLPRLDMEIALDGNNALQSARLTSDDDALDVHIKPEGAGYSILVNICSMTLPAAVPLLIDQAVVNMSLNAATLAIPRIEIALYGGKIIGDARLTWEKGWRTSGRLQVRNVSLHEPSHLISQALYLSGGLSGNARFSAVADTPSALADQLLANIKFDVKNGVLHGLDLAAIATLLTKQTKGGNTQFDIFSGELVVKSKQYTLRDIHMRSGLLTASGQVKVNPDKALDGLIEVALKKGINLAEVPLQVSGTLAAPSVLPTKAAIAGALAGTAILGPGIGTSLGLKAGGAIDKVKGLFQRD